MEDVYKIGGIPSEYTAVRHGILAYQNPRGAW